MRPGLFPLGSPATVPVSSSTFHLGLVESALAPNAGGGSREQ